jgi:WD domain, G-beta repeat
VFLSRFTPHLLAGAERKEQETMARRQLIIERPALSGMHVPTSVQMDVDDRAAIGPWVTTLAGRFGYPLVDSFGTPLPYRLRSVSGELVLPMTGRFADARFPSGSGFILEPVRQSTMQEQGWGSRQADQMPLDARRFSRRSLVGVLAAVSFLGCGSGMTTAFAQRLLTQPLPAVPPIAVRTLFRQHQQTVRALTWSPDGRMIASGADDGMAFVWKVDGTVLFGHQFPVPVGALAWSPDGTQLLAGTATTVSFFNARTGVLLAENAASHTAPITAMGWTQEAVPHALSAGLDTTALVWSVQSHQPLAVFRRHTSAIEALAVLGTIVVTVSDGGVARVWSAQGVQEIHGYYSQSQRPLRTAAFSSTGRLAIGGDDGLISVWGNGQTCQRQVQDAFGVHCLDEANMRDLACIQRLCQRCRTRQDRSTFASDRNNRPKSS